jgi:hypothetical protein
MNLQKATIGNSELRLIIKISSETYLDCEVDERQWENVYDLEAQKRKIYTPDYIGYSFTDKATPYRPTVSIQDLTLRDVKIARFEPRGNEN